MSSFVRLTPRCRVRGDIPGDAAFGIPDLRDLLRVDQTLK